MTHLPHGLTTQFPGDDAALRRLKGEDRHFQTLVDGYAALDDEIRGIEAGTLPAASDDHLENLKKQRLALLDQIAGMVADARRLA